MSARSRTNADATLLFRIEAPVTECERLVAELGSLGTLGVEERDTDASTRLLLAYFSAHAPTAEIMGLDDPARRVCVSEPESVPDTDWEREWRRGLAPRKVGPLWIRPSWCASQGEPELIIDPEQAFGSGEHATTRLALQLLLAELLPGEHVLDVGCGSGILSLAALRLGAGAALGLEIDPVACRNAAGNARRNGLALALVCGTPAALRAELRFELVVCNMLLSRLEPWLAQVAAHATRRLVIAGQLESERTRLDVLLRQSSWRTERELEEAQSGDLWCARVLAQG